MTKLSHHTAPLVPVADKFRSSLDRNADRLQALDEQAFVLVLRKDAQIRVRGQAHANVLEVEAGLALAARPKVYGGNLMRSRDNGAGKIELPVEFERAGLNGERARGRARLGGLVDDPHARAELGQPKGEDKAGRTGANDQDIASHDSRLPRARRRNAQFAALSYRGSRPHDHRDHDKRNDDQRTTRDEDVAEMVSRVALAHGLLVRFGHDRSFVRVAHRPLPFLFMTRPNLRAR
jgi:hypothetical protein